MSNKALSDLKISMGFETDTMSVKAAGVFDQPMHYTSSGHPALKLDKSKTDTSFPDQFLTYQADEEPTTPHFGKPSEFEDVCVLKRQRKKHLMRNVDFVEQSRCRASCS